MNIIPKIQKIKIKNLTFDLVRCMNSIIWWDMSKILHVTSLVTSLIYGDFVTKRQFKVPTLYGPHLIVLSKGAPSIGKN